MEDPRSTGPHVHLPARSAKDGYWGGVVPPARDEPALVDEAYTHTQEMLDAHVASVDFGTKMHELAIASSNVVVDPDIPDGSPGIVGDMDEIRRLMTPDDKAPRNRAERRAADKQAKQLRRRATREADRQMKALEATMSPEEIAAAKKLAAKTLGVRGGR
jgi:hypothetical protein